VGHCHSVLVPHPNKEQATLIAVNRDLPDQLVENLAKELFALLADAVLPRVFLEQSDV